MADSNLPPPPPREPHLWDAAAVLEGATWLVGFVIVSGVSGVIGNAAYDYLKSVRRRHGRDRIVELEENVLQIVDEEAAKAGKDSTAVRAKLTNLFEDFR